MGFIFDLDLADRVRRAMEINPSAHDGAVAFGRLTADRPYLCAGWSYRIIANHTPAGADPNRGAAYNSAIALSMTRRIDAVFLFTRDELEIFMAGNRVA